MQSQARRLERDVGLFFERVAHFHSDAGLRDVKNAAVDELVDSLAIFPDDLNGRGFCGSLMSAKVSLIHRYIWYIIAGQWAARLVWRYIVLRCN